MTTVLVVNLPGHLTHDSLTQIAEGSSGYAQSWNPLFSSWVFGKLVNLTGGTEVIVAISVSTVAAAIYLILQAGPSTGWWPLIPIGLLLFTPILIIHPGVIWKDVWFAHLGLLGFALVALRARGAGWWSECLALVCLAAAMLSRQTGILIALAGVAALSVVRQHGPVGTAHGLWPRWFRLAGWMPGLLLRTAALLAVAAGLGGVAKSQFKSIAGGEVGTGVRLVAIYDIAGMLQRLPGVHLERLRAEGFGTQAWEASARATFSGERIDRLELAPITGSKELTQELILAQWFDLATANPLAYIQHRLEVFAWLSGLREQAKCIPVHVGVEAGPQTPTANLSLRPSRFAPLLYHWSRSFVNTPYFAPLFWAAWSIAVIALVVWRAGWRDPIVWLQLAGLAYWLSYLAAGLSCDFRYTYFSVLASSVGVMYACAGIPFRREPADQRPTVAAAASAPS
jgi:hypothetical protein